MGIQHSPKGAQPPLSAHVYCGQTVTHLSYWWAIVIHNQYCTHFLLHSGLGWLGLGLGLRRPIGLGLGLGLVLALVLALVLHNKRPVQGPILYHFVLCLYRSGANSRRHHCGRWLGLCQYAEYRHRSSSPAQLNCLSSYTCVRQCLKCGPARPGQGSEARSGGPHFRLLDRVSLALACFPLASCDYCTTSLKKT